MAYSTQRAVSDGTMVYLDISIGYQSRNDIKVFYDDLPADPLTWSWVGTTEKRIAFSPAVPAGVEVLIQRTTRIDRIINKFALGAKFNNNTMDMNFEQVLYLTQEAVEGSALSDIFNDVDFHNYKIKNLGLAVDPNDAITYGQVQSMSTGAYNAQLAAEAARDKAQQWATQLTTPVESGNFSSKQYALNASTSATASANSATASQTSATNSANSAAASQASRLASEAARDATFVARDEALGAAAPATEIYDRLDTVEANTAAHVANVSNPHAVTKAQVGLGNAENTADINKTVASALRLRNGASASGTQMVFTWSGQSGQPGWLWGGNDGTNMFVYNPSNFSVNYANGAGYATDAGKVNGISGWNYSNRNYNPPYLWATAGSGSDQFLVQPGNLSVAWSNRVGSVHDATGGNVHGTINILGGPTASEYGYDAIVGGNFRSNKSSSHWWRWHWNDPDSNLYCFVDDNNVGWVPRNSDERLKEDIVDLVSDEDKFLALRPVNFRWKLSPTVSNNSKKMDGLLAQNVRDSFPDATGGDFETGPDETGRFMFPGTVDDRAVSAHIIYHLQKAILRIRELEAQLKKE